MLHLIQLKPHIYIFFLTNSITVSPLHTERSARSFFFTVSILSSQAMERQFSLSIVLLLLAAAAFAEKAQTKVQELKLKLERCKSDIDKELQLIWAMDPKEQRISIPNLRLKYEGGRFEDAFYLGQCREHLEREINRYNAATTTTSKASTNSFRTSSAQTSRKSPTSNQEALRLRIQRCKSDIDRELQLIWRMDGREQTKRIHNLVLKYKGDGRAENAFFYGECRYHLNSEINRYNAATTTTSKASETSYRSSSCATIEQCKSEINQELKLVWGKGEKQKKETIKRLKLRWHPDKNHGNEKFAEEVFKHLNAQIELLSTGDRSFRNWG
jgi:hypothetical protein